MPLQENDLLRVECTDRIREVGQPNGERRRRKGQNGDVRQCEGTGSRRMKELCDECGIRIILLVPYSPSSNGVATKDTWAMLCGSGLPPRFWAEAMGTFMYLRNRTPMATNVPYELFYRIKPDMDHIRTFECMVKVVRPSQALGNA